MRSVQEIRPPANPPSPLPRQNKVIMQRQYREKEGERFSELREIIRQLTGEELQTRHEVLRKAIEVLRSVLKDGRQEQFQVVPPVSYEMPATAVTDPAEATSPHLDYPAQPSHWSQPWQNAEYDVQGAYYAALSHGQEYHLMSNMDAAFEEGDYQEFGENWSNGRQF